MRRERESDYVYMRWRERRVIECIHIRERERERMRMREMKIMMSELCNDDSR